MFVRALHAKAQVGVVLPVQKVQVNLNPNTNLKWKTLQNGTYHFHSELLTRLQRTDIWALIRIRMQVKS